MCVSKLASQMLITITNSNSTPEVNSSEVSLKLQWELCVCTQKHSNHLLGGDLGTFAHMCLYTNSFLSRIRILKTNYNHHCNDHSNYEFSLVCKVHHSKEELQSSLQWWFKLHNFLSCVTERSAWGLRFHYMYVQCLSYGHSDPEILILFTMNCI